MNVIWIHFFPITFQIHHFLGSNSIFHVFIRKMLISVCPNRQTYFSSADTAEDLFVLFLIFQKILSQTRKNSLKSDADGS